MGHHTIASNILYKYSIKNHSQRKFHVNSNIVLIQPHSIYHICITIFCFIKKLE